MVWPVLLVREGARPNDIVATTMRTRRRDCHNDAVAEAKRGAGRAGLSAARALGRQAGITNPLDEIDVAEIYVPVSWYEPMCLENLGLLRIALAATNVLT